MQEEGVVSAKSAKKLRQYGEINMREEWYLSFTFLDGLIRISFTTVHAFMSHDNLSLPLVYFLRFIDNLTPVKVHPTVHFHPRFSAIYSDRHSACPAN